MSAKLSEENKKEASLLAGKNGNYGKVTPQNPEALGPAKVVRNEMGKPVLGPNGKPVAKGGKRKTLKRKTRKALKRRRYSRRH